MVLAGLTMISVPTEKGKTMRLIDAHTLKKLILEERDKIPLTVPAAYYELVKEKPYRHGQSMRGGIRKALRCLERCPKADAVEVVHGRWEQVEDFDGEYHWRCSACGCEWWFEAGGPVENGSHYCPNCGAKMDGERNNNV